MSNSSHMIEVYFLFPGSPDWWVVFLQCWRNRVCSVLSACRLPYMAVRVCLRSLWGPSGDSCEKCPCAEAWREEHILPAHVPPPRAPPPCHTWLWRGCQTAAHHVRHQTGGGLGAQWAVPFQSHSPCKGSGVTHGVIFSADCLQAGCKVLITLSRVSSVLLGRLSFRDYNCLKNAKNITIDFLNHAKDGWFCLIKNIRDFSSSKQ